MKITQVMLSKGWGGAERLFVELCLGLADSGQQVQVICGSRFERGAALMTHPAISYHAVPALGNWDLYSYWKVRRCVAAFAPDVIHSHLTRASWMSGLIGKKLAIPTVATAHNWIGKKYIANIDYFSAITSELRQHLVSLGIDPERIRGIPNFSLLVPVAAPAANDHVPPVFVTLGRFVKKKGFLELLQAFHRYVREVGPARLLIGGSGPEEGVLRSFVATHGLEASVTFVGWVENVAAFLEQGDIFVLPSLDEPFGIVLLEAMAVGKPIVATRTSGPNDLLTDDAGYFVQVGDVADLLRGLSAAAGEPELRRAKAARALTLYRDNYRRDVVVPRFIAYYRDICATAS